ncbi:MAG: sugar phosphate isomerase/epimerase [Planctomycetes bacterium]|nr:sugar phosphate isomerase/epimerase [Planctomycetota bacterium]NOG54007.1 sugar phosphate isomerase/epimerase [Planctomycetota bacterium]
MSQKDTHRDRIALQLYTVRDYVADDMLGALSRAADLGFAGVEFAGLFEHDPEALRAHLDSVGLAVCGTHTGLDQLANDFAGCVRDARTLGTDIIVVPYLAQEYRGAPGYAEATTMMTDFARRLKDEGMRLAYHNHSFELEPCRSDSLERGIDIIIAESPADLVLLEIDVYWLRHGGVNPLAFLKQYATRCPLLHLKDMSDEQSRRFAEIGTGILDFAAIVTRARQAGVEWLIVEQDSDFESDSFESAARSLQNLQSICQSIDTEA